MTAAVLPALPKGLTEASTMLGHRVWQAAIWHDGRCNWVGAEPLERNDKERRAFATHRSLGPDLYAGTSGIALFLAELFEVTGEERARRTARGAIRHAFQHVEDVPHPFRLGLFTGWTGIAVAAYRVGVLLREPEWQEHALALAHRCAAELAPTSQFDVISGHAGAIVGLVLLSRAGGQPVLLDLAVRLGDELVESATRDRSGWSWKSPGMRTIHNLTGFSHGTAGAAYALVEIFLATGDSRYREAAEFAFRYERRWFTSQEENWPDFREDHFAGRRPRGQPFSFATFWCHGAPGIALSRLRAYECLGDEACREEATTALRTTRNAVQAALETGTWNYSLCHGLSGNADVLLDASRSLDVDCDANAELCNAVASKGVERYIVPASAWPCGTHTDETPNLMLGLAGIGLFYLRVDNPSVPSVLLLRPDGKGGTRTRTEFHATKVERRQEFHVPLPKGR